MSSNQTRAQLLSQANNQLLRIAYTSGRVTCRTRAEGGASEGMTVEKLRKIGDLARAIVGARNEGGARDSAVNRVIVNESEWQL